MHEPANSTSPAPPRAVRPSGYVSRSEELWYGIASPLYDLMTWFCFLPLGGERACRRQFVEWFGIESGGDVLSLCCGTGTTERTIVAVAPTARVTAIDLGAGQIATARRKDRSGLVEYRIGDASATGFEPRTFDRVLITLALHEMPRELRLAILREAARVCRPGGRVIAIEHAPVSSRRARLARSLWWFGWLPGNPERATSMDLQRSGLANEMGRSGLRVIERHATSPAWVEGIVAEPACSRA